MRRIIAWVLPILLFVPAAHACINSVGTDHRGNRFMPSFYTGETLLASLTSGGDRDYSIRRTDQIIAAAQKEPNLQSLTNLAINVIYHGRYDEAIRLLLALEKRYPGHHETAANLGTALELSGRDQIALRWIRIGIQRNSEEHYGTEWLHARILEAKLESARNANYLDMHSIVGLRFDSALIPSVPKDMPNGNNGKPTEPWKVNQALNYQLHERLQFVKAPDPVVANLLLDWATLNLAGGSVESADVLYDLAIKYGASRTPLIAARKTEIHAVLARTKSKEEPETFMCAICVPPPDTDPT